MSITLLSLSCLVLAAVAVPRKDRPSPLRRLLATLFAKVSRALAPSYEGAGCIVPASQSEIRNPQSTVANIVSPPRVRSDEGWTLIHCDDVEAFGQWLDRDEEGLPGKNGEEPSLGSHLLIELYGCDGRLLEQEDSVGLAMREAAQRSEATVVAESFHEFKPYGVSGAVIIQESHYTIHTWPEHGYAAVDLFYCGGTVLVHRAVDVLRARFRPERIKFLVVRRGLQSEVER